MRSQKVPFYFAQTISASLQGQMLIVVKTSPKHLLTVEAAILSMADEGAGILHVSGLPNSTLVYLIKKEGEDCLRTRVRFRRHLAYKLTSKAKNS